MDLEQSLIIMLRKREARDGDCANNFRFWVTGDEKSHGGLQLPPAVVREMEPLRLHKEFLVGSPSRLKG